MVGLSLKNYRAVRLEIFWGDGECVIENTETSENGTKGA